MTTVSDSSDTCTFLVLIFRADISIDGDTAVAFTENVEQRFLSYGWQVLHVDDGDKSVALNQFERVDADRDIAILSPFTTPLLLPRQRRTSLRLFVSGPRSVTARSSREHTVFTALVSIRISYRSPVLIMSSYSLEGRRYCRPQVEGQLPS